MGEENVFSKEFEIPENYYIDINGGSSGNFDHLKESLFGECYIGVYKSLDKGCGIPPVEHLIEVGKFLIKDVEKMKVNHFLRKVREGIEKMINSEGNC